MRRPTWVELETWLLLVLIFAIACAAIAAVFSIGEHEAIPFVDRFVQMAVTFGSAIGAFIGTLMMARLLALGKLWPVVLSGIVAFFTTIPFAIYCAWWLAEEVGYRW